MRKYKGIRCLQYVLSLSVCGLVVILSACRERGDEPQQANVKKEQELIAPKTDISQKGKSKEGQKSLPKSNEETEEQEAIKPKSYSIFSQGVTPSGGWYDIDKQGVREDVAACWLITASNMIQWWQDRYVERGYTLPEGTPNGGSTSKYNSQIFDAGIASFLDLHRGSDIKAGLLWYKSGESLGISNHSYPKPGTGGYLKTVPDNLFRYSEQYFVSYDSWKDSSSDEEALRIFSSSLLTKLRKGSVLGMDIKTHVDLGGILHAITLWGVEVDNRGNILSLYITDSDDGEHRLVRCPIEVHLHSSYKYWEIAMNVPSELAYNGGAKWSVLKLYELECPGTK